MSQNVDNFGKDDIIVINDNTQKKEETEVKSSKTKKPSTPAPKVSGFKDFMKRAFNLEFLPITLCVFACFFYFIARFIGLVSSSMVINVFAFIGYTCTLSALVIYCITAFLNKKLDFTPVLFIVLVCLFAL